jgi:hypothetical protein
VWHAIVGGAGTARQAIGINKIVPVSDGRHAFEGRILQPGDPVYDLYVGKPAAPNGSRQNPITYFDSPLDRRVCACGYLFPAVAPPLAQWVQSMC